MAIDKQESYIDVINLPLDFSKELQLPETFDEFENVIQSNDFKYGFKIYLNRIVPFSEGVESNTALHIIKDLKELFNKTYLVEHFYITIVDGKYFFHVDENINSGKVVIKNGLSKPNGEIEELKESCFEKVMKLLKLKKKENVPNVVIDPSIVIDPYITQYILGYLKSLPDYKDWPLISIKTISESDDSFFVEYETVRTKESIKLGFLDDGNTFTSPIIHKTEQTYGRNRIILKADLKIIND